MNTSDPRVSLRTGIALVRAGQPEEALPHLERATADPELRYAKAVRIYAQALANGVETFDVTHQGRTLKFLLVPGNLGLDLHHAEGAFFEAPELDYCAQVIPRRSVILDVGANTGNHTLFFLAFLQPRLVIPVEPVPAAVSTLRRNLRLNGLSVDERGLGLAAGRIEGWVHVDARSDRDLVVARTSEGSAGAGTVVRSVRLDDLVPERVDFLKIDVEGFEAEVLAGANRILREDKPILMLEASDASRDALLMDLEKLGYRRDRAHQADEYQNVFLSVR